MDDPWQTWADRLAQQLATLGEHEFLNTWGPRITEERSQGLFGRRRKPRLISAPVVRYLGTEGQLLCETVAPFPAPDQPAVNEDQRAELSRLGWLMPGDDGYEPMGGPFCRVYLPVAEAPRAAELAAQTYVALGVAGPEEIEMERGR